MKKALKKNYTFMKFKNLNIHGNILDDGWLKNLKYKNGKTHVNAVLILSEIVYWYRPTPVKDERTGKLRGYKKKFEADKLQKSYDDLAIRFGLTKSQAKAAVIFLEEKGLITTEFRTVVYAHRKRANNVLFIEAVYEEIEKITGSDEVVDDEEIYADKEFDNNDPEGLEVQEDENKQKEPDKPEKKKEPQEKIDEKELEQLKDKFESTTEGKTNINYIKKVLNESDKKSFDAVLEKWKEIVPDNLETVEGFFRDACRKEKKGYGYSKRQRKVNKGTKAGKPIQATNFEQRKYDDEFIDSLYDNF